MSSLRQGREYALSSPGGVMRHAKDFDWMRQNVPCRTACPADTDIPGYLEAIHRGDPETAYRINLRDNVFPAVLGRACTRPCEPACRHGWAGLGEPVAICFAKRSADDFRARREPVVLDKIFPPSGKRVLIVGGGPAGLTAARELALWGHAVTVLEQHPEAGGMMVQGIPDFRLPRDIVRREIDQIRALGVEIVCGQSIDPAGLAARTADFDAGILATGTQIPRWPDCPGRDLPEVRHGLDYLKAVNAGHPPPPARRVAVIGGGFTAVDCARIARRLGAESVDFYYRRSEAEMTIGGHELSQFELEGIRAHFQVAPLEFLADEAGRLRGLRLVRTELTAVEGGRAVPRPVTGSEFEVEVDRVLLGTGQQAAPDFALPDGWWRAGDVANGSASLVEAIGHGKAVAREVDRALCGRDRFEEVVIAEAADTTGRSREMDAIPRLTMPELPLAARTLTAEVEQGLSEADAQTEASRCYLCHYKFEIDNDLCIYCDRCLKVKPVENCIVKVSDLIYDGADRITGYVRSTHTRDYHRLHLDQNACIRCGACVEVCPVECISLQKVTRLIRPAGAEKA